MKMLLIGACVVVGVGILALVVWSIGLRRAAEAVTGKPTPEEARVAVDAATTKAKQETDAKVQEVKNEPPDDAIRRARERSRRGLRGVE